MKLKGLTIGKITIIHQIKAYAIGRVNRGVPGAKHIEPKRQCQRIIGDMSEGRSGFIIALVEVHQNTSQRVC